MRVDNQQKQLVRKVLEDLYGMGVEEGASTATIGLRDHYITSRKKEKVDEAMDVIERIVP